MLAATPSRVPAHTAEYINRRIAAEIDANIVYFARHRGEIDARLRALDREWDIERVLEANAALLAFVGVVLGARRRKGLWLFLPAAVTGFLFQHAIEGCPPLPFLRRLGYRTMREIETERCALLRLRDEWTVVGASEDEFSGQP
jgi:hypothetical protein